MSALSSKLNTAVEVRRMPKTGLPVRGPAERQNLTARVLTKAGESEPRAQSRRNVTSCQLHFRWHGELRRFQDLVRRFQAIGRLSSSMIAIKFTALWASSRLRLASFQIQRMKR